MTNPSSQQPRTLLSGVHAASARAILLVGIGEFIWPSGEPVWSSTLVDYLAEFGFEDNAARKAIQRTARSGLIVAARDGRRVQWRITPDGQRMLQSGADRVFHWHERPRDWDGQWLLLTVTVPESRRQLRHHLQKRLQWAGLGSPVPGQWLSPHPDRSADVEAIVDDLGLREQAQSFIGRHAQIGSEGALIRQAWDLGDLAASYREFIARFGSWAATTDRAALLDRIELVQEWRMFPYLDPDLPREYLPADWPGDEATQVFWHTYELVRRPSDRFWATLVSR